MGGAFSRRGSIELLTLMRNLCSFFVSAIEKFWFTAKNYFNKRLLAADAELKEKRFRDLVLESVNSVPKEKVLRLCASNRGYVAQVLQSQAQPRDRQASEPQ